MTRVRVRVLVACGLGVALLWFLERTPASEDAPLALVEASVPQPRIVRLGDASRVEAVALGRLFTIEVDGQGPDTDVALTAAVERLGELDARFSEWRPGSDLWKINARAGYDPVEVHEDTRRLLRAAVSLSAATGGLYEPTLGPVRVLWPFGDPSRPLPGRAELDRALRLVNVSRMDIESRTVRLPEEGMRLALGGLDVAFSTRGVMTVLEEHGVRSAVVRAGRDIMARGEGEGALGTIAIANPRWPRRAVERFHVRGRSVATIDDTHGALVHEGRVLPPVLDPRSGDPAAGCRSVTVVAEDPLVARAHATAIFVLGPERGLAWASANPGLSALVVDTEGRTSRSDGWHEVALPFTAPPQMALLGPPLADAGLRAPPVQSATPSRAPSRRPTSTPSWPARSRGAQRRRDDVLVAGDEYGTAFRLDRTEVTNEAYRRFLEVERENPHGFCHPDEPEAHDHTPRYHRHFSPRLVRSSVAGALAPFDRRTFQNPDHPVVGVGYWDAWAFARWSGQRLPTRSEMERACRGGDDRSWPFGDRWDPSAVNSGGERDGERDGYIYAAPADSFPAGASPGGCVHLAGNVAEWTEEAWVVGGSSRSNATGVACGAGRPREPSFRAFDVGFRCALDVQRSDGPEGPEGGRR